MLPKLGGGGNGEMVTKGYKVSAMQVISQRATAQHRACHLTYCIADLEIC